MVSYYYFFPLLLFVMCPVLLFGVCVCYSFVFSLNLPLIHKISDSKSVLC